MSCLAAVPELAHAADAPHLPPVVQRQAMTNETGFVNKF